MDGSSPPRVYSFQSVFRSHAGHHRLLNEDRLLVQPDDGFWVVADGMGGQPGGDLAASRLVEALASINHHAAGYTRLNDVVRQIDLTNAALFDAEGPGAAGGSTLVALLAHDGHYACLWAGDSRAYIFRDGELSPITRDHSVVQALVDGGVISEAERKRHPSAHVITRAVGAKPQLDLEQRFAPICEADVFLLCSDGLTTCVQDTEIAAILQGETLSAGADRLLDLALERGAPDNVSLILVQAALGPSL
jgi:serine/threonine protein phosphatase PrpC